MYFINYDDPEVRNKALTGMGKFCAQTDNRLLYGFNYKMITNDVRGASNAVLFSRLFLRTTLRIYAG